MVVILILLDVDGFIKLEGVEYWIFYWFLVFVFVMFVFFFWLLWERNFKLLVLLSCFRNE